MEEPGRKRCLQGAVYGNYIIPWLQKLKVAVVFGGGDEYLNYTCFENERNGRREEVVEQLVKRCQSELLTTISAAFLRPRYHWNGRSASTALTLDLDPIRQLN
jgi:hypothetical protein